MARSQKSLEKMTKSELVKLINSKKTKSVITTEAEKPKSVLGEFVIIYEKPTDSGFVPLRISYAPFKQGNSGMISIRAWNNRQKSHNYTSFNVASTFGDLDGFMKALKACEFTEYKKVE